MLIQNNLLSLIFLDLLFTEFLRSKNQLQAHVIVIWNYSELNLKKIYRNLIPILHVCMNCLSSARKSLLPTLLTIAVIFQPAIRHPEMAFS